MPFTPFHFGPCSTAALIWRRQFDLPVFALANVFIDLEPLSVMVFRLNAPEHGPFHSFTVGILVAAAWTAVAWFGLRGAFGTLMRAAHLPYETTPLKMFVSALAGVWSHVFLDGMLYQEVKPFYPLEGNPFVGLLSLPAVYKICALSFLPAIWLYFRALKNERAVK